MNEVSVGGFSPPPTVEMKGVFVDDYPAPDYRRDEWSTWGRFYTGFNYITSTAVELNETCLLYTSPSPRD